VTYTPLGLRSAPVSGGSSDVYFPALAGSGTLTSRDAGRVVGELRRTSDEFRAEFLNADKYLEKPASAPAAVAPPAVPATTPSDPNESAFDREMREARERLAASREKPAT